MQRRRKTTKEERVCSICSQHFAKAEHLHRHFRSHTKEKPFTCLVCDKKFTRQDTLLRHSRSHQTPQPTLTEETSQSPQTQDGDGMMVETIHICNAPQGQALPVSQHNTTNSISASILESASDELITTGNTELDDMLSNAVPMYLAEQQYDRLPQWGAEINLSTDWLAELTRDQSDPNWLASHILDSVSETSPYASGLGQPASTQTPANTKLVSTLEPGTRTSCGKSVQKKWYTYTGLTTSGYDTPDESNDGNQIDEACHQTLADRLRQQVQDGPVPSIAFLWDLHLAKSRRSNASILGIQAAVIGQMFGLLMGRPKDLAQIDIFHGSCVAWTRQLKLSQPQEPGFDAAQLEGLEGQELEAAWRRWAKSEERKRLMLALLLQDTEIACLFHHDPLMPHSVEFIPRIASNEAFCAPDARSWKAVVINEVSLSPIQERDISQDSAVLSSFPLVSSDFELLVILRCIGTVSIHHQNLVPSQTAASQCQDALISWYKRYRASIAFQQQEPGLLMLWHSMFMLLHMNLDILECFCGREGPAIAEIHYEKVKSWANSDHAMICIIHAMFVIKHFERLSIGSDPPIPSVLCLYRCGIAWYCYVSFVDKTALSFREEPRMPELQAVGSAGGVSLLQNAVMKDVKAGASLLFRIILLLQRRTRQRSFKPLKLYTGNAHGFYYELHQKYGPIVRTGPNIVSISDPSAIAPIYAIGSKFLKSSFYTIFDTFYKDNPMPTTFSVRDPSRHQALRRPVAQKFSMSSIKSMEVFADECSEIFLSCMKQLQGTEVDLGKWLQWYAFDVISAITFHRRFGFMELRKDVESMISDISSSLVVGAMVAQVPAIYPWTIGNNYVAKFLAWQPFIRVPDPMRTVVKFTEHCIEQYDKNPPEQDRPDFLGWLRQENAKGEKMSQRDLVNHLSNNLLAGSDTTAISLRATIYYLLKNPEYFAKAQAEVDQADQEGKLSKYITYAECLQLPYLQAVMKEAMRCCPGVSFPLERIVPAGGAQLCGVHLQEGTIVGINPAVIHRDKSIFGRDADKFNPERWLGPDTENIKKMDRHLMTFGYGSRTCIGKNISIMEMGKLVPAMLRNFDIEWASKSPEWVVKTYWTREKSLQDKDLESG
ncbi:cytochrome p450 oxidoreductase [Fusarium beomiforme]|uniref:Cytochrome p450 oxidoreductase n=1 Tax=Fusarium beomiforme TaxID=44412 RepID=A0A9P5DTC7_9HYPO|nr:cytochrome p450 oxidoreductase [Fusarium beomiforme]